jgi:murein DD-endopeptidase MepM/ murein hydrolase activator NlpD
MVGDAANPEFRWPARGRIIQAFKPGGNDGINIAVPEGTSVKAAESGVVAYAGNELKGYGNLILIRHPNGFVSAYANTSDIEVKRGETVKRGQTIAKSGQSGNVASPQLHFELRKGTTPVDPTQYLAGV